MHPVTHGVGSTHTHKSTNNSTLNCCYQTSHKQHLKPVQLPPDKPHSNRQSAHVDMASLGSLHVTYAMGHTTAVAARILQCHSLSHQTFDSALVHWACCLCFSQSGCEVGPKFWRSDHNSFLECCVRPVHGVILRGHVACLCSCAVACQP